MTYIKKTDNPKMGRPSENLTQNIRLRITPELSAEIDRYAKQNNLSKATAIRQILLSFFSNK